MSVANAPSQPVGRRFVIVAVIIGAALLAGAVAFLVWCVWPASPTHTVRDFESAPEATWQFPLTAGQSVTAISADEALIFTPSVTAEDPVAITLIDVESGSLVWQTSVDEHAEQVGAYWVRPYNLPGTDFIVVKLFHSPPEHQTRHLVIDRESGEIRYVLDTMSDTSLLTDSSGMPYVVDHVAGELSQLRELTQPDDQRWTIPAPDLVDEDGAELHVMHVDGTALVGPKPSGSYMSDKNGLWFLAANVSDGATPPWADTDADQSFVLVDDVVVQIKIADRQLRAVDQRGELLWHLPWQVPVAVGKDLFVIDGEPDSSLTLLDPRTGEPHWQTPATLPAATTVTVIEGRWVAVSPSPDGPPQSITIEADGNLGEPVHYPTGSEAQFHRGSDRLYVTVKASDETVLVAHRPGESHVMWSASYPSGTHVGRLGRHLILIDPDQQVIRGLG